MSTLRNLQREFQRHVQQPGKRMAQEVLSTPQASAAVRLAIYENAYYARLIEALGKDFTALQVVLGEKEFERMGQQFVAASPSRFTNLRWYGGELAAFLVSNAPWQKRPVLAELAAFEWVLAYAFDAADVPLVSIDEVARVPAEAWPAMQFALHPSVRLCELQTNAPQLWRAAIDGKALPRVSRGKARRTWLVWRKALMPYYRALDDDETWALAAVLQGRNFGQLCEGLRRFAGDEHAALRGAQLLKTWLAEGLISALD